MTAAPAIATAATLVWLGMVLAISFLEAPLKFRAPGVTPRIGLGIGRVVFRALNMCEAVLAVALAAALAAAHQPAATGAAGFGAVVVLAVQLGVVRPRLTRRSDLVLAGQDAPRSRSHHVYIALEGLKALALITAGVLLLS
jgi:hypothetical protein